VIIPQSAYSTQPVVPSQAPALSPTAGSAILTVIKRTIPSPDSQVFGFKVSGPQSYSFNLDTNPNTSISDQDSRSNLPPGSYTIKEVLPNYTTYTTTWSCTGVAGAGTVSGGSITGTGNIAQIEIPKDRKTEVVCTFTNIKGEVPPPRGQHIHIVNPQIVTDQIFASYDKDKDKDHTFFNGSVSCPTGSVATGGGYQFGGDDISFSPFFIRQNRPGPASQTDNTPISWSVEGYINGALSTNTNNTKVIGQVYAVCALKETFGHKIYPVLPGNAKHE